METMMRERNPARDYGVELEACPFCGGPATAVTIYHRNAVSKVVPWYAYIQCKKCMAQLASAQMTHTEEQALRLAAEGWNRRVKEKTA